MQRPSKKAQPSSKKAQLSCSEAPSPGDYKSRLYKRSPPTRTSNQDFQLVQAGFACVAATGSRPVQVRCNTVGTPPPICLRKRSPPRERGGAGGGVEAYLSNASNDTS